MTPFCNLFDSCLTVAGNIMYQIIILTYSVTVWQLVWHCLTVAEINMYQIIILNYSVTVWHLSDSCLTVAEYIVW